MNPPVTLDEVYFSCVNSWGTALFNALGISAGNVQLFLQLFTLFGLPLIFIFFKVLACALYFGILRFVIYDIIIYITFHTYYYVVMQLIGVIPTINKKAESETQIIIEQLGIQLMRLQQDKSSRTPKNTLLRRLLAELQHGNADVENTERSVGTTLEAIEASNARRMPVSVGIEINDFHRYDNISSIE